MNAVVGRKIWQEDAQKHFAIVHPYKAPDWKYVCKVWPQPRTVDQNLSDLRLAEHLGIDKNVVCTTSRISRNFMPYLLAACDIYAAPSRLEGFGMVQVEAGACGTPVIGQSISSG